MSHIGSSALLAVSVAICGVSLLLAPGCSGPQNEVSDSDNGDRGNGDSANEDSANEDWEDGSDAGPHDPVEPVSWGPIRNVLLISMDTTRADYLSCYGYPRRTTRSIDVLAEQGVQCDMAIAPTPMTLPSHSTMLTGTTPLIHGVRQNVSYQLGPTHVTLAEVLQEQGYNTGAIVGSKMMAAQFGLAQGFETYDDNLEPFRNESAIAERPGEAVSRLASRWLAERDQRPFFLFLHYFDPHFTYAPPEPFASDYRDDLYAGEIAYTDYCIGQVIGSLKELGLYDSTLIIVTSDHGEMRDEHGETYHSYFIYQGVVRVPLVLRIPGLSRPVRLKQVVGLADIVPTVCRLLDVALNVETSGTDLMAMLGGERSAADARYVYCESVTPTVYGANPLLGLVGSRWKFIQSTRPELYDLAQDAGEIKNLVSLNREQANAMQDQLRDLLENDSGRTPDESLLELDDSTKRGLEALGYVGGEAERPSTVDSSKDDAKDLIDYYQASMRVGYLLSQKKFELAREICLKLAASHPGIATAHLSLAEISAARGEYQNAVGHAKKALAIRPDDAEAHYQLGLALQSLEKTADAIIHYRAALAIQPGKARAHFNLGLALHTQQKLDLAIEHYRRAIENQSDYTQAHNNLAIALYSVGKRDEAIEHVRRALAIDPDNATARENLKRLAP